MNGLCRTRSPPAQTKITAFINQCSNTLQNKTFWPPLDDLHEQRPKHTCRPTPGLPRVVSTALAYSRKIIPFEPKQLQKWNSIKVFLTLTNSTGVTGRRVGSPAPRAVSHLQATHLTELILHLYKPVSFRVIIHSGHLVFSFSEHNRFHMAWHVSSLPEHEHVHENVMGCCFPGIQGHEHVMACFASCMDMSWHVLLTCPWHVMRTCCMSSWFRFTHACVLRPRP